MGANLPKASLFLVLVTTMVVCLVLALSDPDSDHGPLLLIVGLVCAFCAGLIGFWGLMNPAKCGLFGKGDTRWDAVASPGASKAQQLTSVRTASPEQTDPGASPDLARTKTGGGMTKSAVKALVSKKKIRFQEDGYDLDLAYITPQVIAMGFPSEGFEARYRNSMKDVQRFFSTRHEGKYKVYNLCAEKHYKETHFEKVVQYGHNDHNPPPFKVMVDCCDDTEKYTKEDQHNVAALHCKAGKGRTGTLIAAWLQQAKLAVDADEAMNIFGRKRTKNNKGVTIPSQQRYVRYFGRYVREFLEPGKLFEFDYPEITLKRVTLKHAPNFDVGGGCDPYFKIVDGVNLKNKLYDMRKDKANKVLKWGKKGSKTEKRIFEVDIKLKGDVKFMFYDHDTFGGDDKMFTCWLNTGFLRKSKYTFGKNSLDGAIKDKKHKKFDEHFTCTFEFEDVKDAVETEDLDENDTPFIPIKVKKAADEDVGSSADESEEEEDQVD